MTDVRVLLVDGNSQTLNELKERLESAGYQVSTTLDRHGLHEHLTHHIPDVILIDGDIRGYEVRDLVANVKERFEFLPTIVMTSEQDPSSVADGMRRGAFDSAYDNTA